MNDTRRPLVDIHIDTLKPYVPGKPIEELERELGITGSIKLASNENPLGPSPRAVEAIAGRLGELHIYPDAAAHALRQALAKYHGVDAAEITTGNGSNELLTLAVRTFCRSYHDHAVISQFGFAAYAIILQSHNVRTTTVEMVEGLGYDLDAMLEAIGEDTSIVFVDNPNNPTGTYLPAERLRAFLAAVPDDVVVVVDEAYHDYVTADDYASAETMRDVHERLIVCRTFSKIYGLAGLRVGYAIAPPAMIDMINRVREPFNCNLLAQPAAVAALGDEAFLQESVRVNEAGRGQMEAALEAMAPLGVSWTPSQTNFLLVRTPHAATQVYEGLLRKGVIVRPMGGGRLVNDLRITIGTAEQVERCMKALAEVLDAIGQSKESAR